MSFEQETYERLHFDHDPLKVVVAQVRFPVVHGLATPEVQAKLQAALADRFPTALAPVQEVEVNFTPQAASQKVTQTAIRFGEAAGERIVSIGPEMVSFETTRYAGWEEFSADFAQLIGVVDQFAPISAISRFGLRYVDEMVVDGASDIDDWANILRQNLLGAEDSLARDPRAVRSIQLVTIELDDAIVTLRHGFTRGSGDEGPASTYLIDTDVFIGAMGAWDVAALMQRAERFHDLTSIVFARSLTEHGIERLGGRR